MSSADQVCAVVYGPGSSGQEAVAGLEAQSRRPDAVLSAATLGLAVRATRSRSARWVWLLDRRSMPEARALEAMLAACELAGSPHPVLLSSKVVDGHGRLHPAALPRHEIYAGEHSVNAVERRLVQLRAAAAGSVLVERGALEQATPPRSDLPPGLDMHEWSARLLRGPGRLGYLVPASVVVLPLSEPAPVGFRARLRILGSSAWTPREKLREAYSLTREAAGEVRGGRRWGSPASGRRADRGG